MSERNEYEPEENAAKHFSMIRPEELASLEEGSVPFNSLIQVFGEQHSPAFQKLEEPDPEGSTLSQYREEAREYIKQLLSDNNVVALVGPSRSAKTEAVIGGQAPSFSFDDSLIAQLQAYIIPYEKYGDASLEQIIHTMEYRISESDPGKEKIILIDEYIPDEHGAAVLSHFIQSGYKIVVCQGGRLSNEVKNNNVAKLNDMVPYKPMIPTVEISVKPLSSSQVEEMFNKYSEVSKSDEKILQQAQQCLTIIQQISATVPIPYHLANKIISEITRKGYYEDSENLATTADNTFAEWKALITSMLEENHYGNAVSLERAKAL